MTGEVLYYAGAAVSCAALAAGAIFSICCAVRARRLKGRLTEEYGERPAKRR